MRHLYINTEPKQKMLKQYFAMPAKTLPMQVAPEQHDAFWTEVNAQLLALPGVEARKHERFYSTQEALDTAHHFSLSALEGERRHTLKEIAIRINATNTVEVKPYRDWLPLCALTQVIDYIKAYQAEVQKRHVQAVKEQKVHDLKIKTLTAPLKKLAKARQLTIGFEETTNRLRVHILLSAKEDLTLSIPYRNYQAIAPKLLEMTENLLNMKALGVSIKQQQPRFSQHRTDSLDWFDPNEQ